MTTVETVGPSLLSPGRRQAFEDRGSLVVREVFAPDEVAEDSSGKVEPHRHRGTEKKKAGRSQEKESNEPDD